MNIHFLHKYLKEKFNNSGILEAYYDFSGFSNGLIKNKVYDDKTQFSPYLSGFVINREYSPAGFNTTYSFNQYSGTGIFNGKNYFQIYNDLDNSSNCLFLNITNLNCNKNFSLPPETINIPSGNCQIISHIKDKSTNEFNIFVSLNDANKLSLEFSGKKDGISERYSATLLSELARQNIIKLNFGGNILNLSYHDIIENENSEVEIITSGNYFDQTKEIFIGSSPYISPNKNYTGYFGGITDFLLISGYINDEDGLNISKIFNKTGENISTIYSTGIIYDIITSGFLNPTGIIGTGITGYQLVLDKANFLSGTLTGIYYYSGLSGALTGEKIDYIKIYNSKIVNTNSIITITNLYDQNYLKNFSKDYIIFNNKLSGGDIYNIQNYLDSSLREDVLDYNLRFDTYSANESVSGKNFYHYTSGLYQSGVEYQNDKVYKIKNLIGNSSINQNSFYQLSDHTGFNFTNLSYDQTKTVVAGKYLVYTASTGVSNLRNPNIFLNGRRLISGYEYSLSRAASLNILYVNTGLGTGYLTIGGNDNFIGFSTGSNVKYIVNPSGNNEKIWVNGLAKSKGADYILTSCFNNLLLNNNDISYKNESIYTEEYNRFNVI